MEIVIRFDMVYNKLTKIHWSLSKWLSPGPLMYVLIFCIFPMSEAHSQGIVSNKNHMIEKQLKSRGISDERVLDAMSMVPRHKFVSAEQEEYAYSDRPLPIGHDQTISQPFIVAFMTEALVVNSGDKILEIGSGSGYQAAILAEMGAEVYTIELIPELARMAADNLRNAGYTDVHVMQGNGYLGWPEEAPFDGIIVTAAPEKVPQALIDQLKVGGAIILPVGPAGAVQSLKKIVKKKKGTSVTELSPVRFVPMVDPEK